jgi:hypothetical protein
MTRTKLGAYSLAKRYEVSAQAMTLRLVNLLSRGRL